MSSDLKLFEMTKNHMRHLTESSIAALLVSVFISCLSSALLHLYSLRQVNITYPPVPNGFILAEISINIFLTILTAAVISSHLAKPRLIEDHQKHLNRFLLSLLISSLAFSLPFRGFAEIIRGRTGSPSWLFLMCHDFVTAAGSCLLFICLWTYPSIWAVSQERTIIPYKASLCILYAALRFSFSFAFRIHFEPLPVQHLFSLVGMFARNRNLYLNPVPFSCILAISITECILIFCIYRNYLLCSKALYNANDPSKQQGIIALWYYARAVVILCAATIVPAVARLASPAAQAANLLRETSVIVLSAPIGDSAVSLAVLSYALREVYVHCPMEEKDVQFIFYLFARYLSGMSHEKTAKEVDIDLLYRIADERDPQTDDPIPQTNTFSFESAMLLFNTSWLATTYATKGMTPLTPSDFGRPMSAVRAVVSDLNKTVVAVILEQMDRLVVAFKPVLADVEKRDGLQKLQKTRFGRSFIDLTEDDHELLPLKEMNVSVEKVLKRCKLHHGFSEAYSSIQMKLHFHVRDLTIDTSRPLYITGFGSGGALATICAFDLSLRRMSDGNAISLYTYGSPRALSLDMATLFEAIVPCRWRCVVAGDCNTVKPSKSSYRHVSKVATFTRSGHLALECNRVYKWWQSEVSAFPMHKISSYYCAFAKWHESYHVKGSIDLWDWQIDKTVAALFCHDTTPSNDMCTADFLLESPITDVEAKSVRTVGEAISWPSIPLDDVVAFKR